MTYWSQIWKSISNVEFKKEPYMWKFYESLLNGISLKNKKVLEIGCGTGFNSVMMVSKGAKLTFFDQSPEALKIVKKTLDKLGLDAELLCGNVFDYDFENDYDITHGEGVIEHFKGEKRQEIVDIHANSIKKGGMVMMIVPNAKSPPYRIGKYIAEKTKTWIHGPEYPYLKRELDRRMRLAGLTMEKQSGGEFLFSFGWLLSPLWLLNPVILKRSIETPAKNKIFRLNYDNFFANRWGRTTAGVWRKL